jgi:hypothetical protein
MSRNEDIWAERGQRAADKWTDHPIRQSLKWLAIILVGIFVLGFVSNTLGFVSLWGNEVKRVVSPDNVRTQFGVLYDNYEALESIAGNVCAAQDVQTNNTLLESPEFAYAAQYRRVEAQYNARSRDIFQGKVVGPPDLPKTAPTLEEMKVNVCP